MLFQQLNTRLIGGNFKSFNLTVALASGDKLTVIVSPVSKDGKSETLPFVVTATAAELDTQFATAFDQVSKVDDQTIADQVAAQVKARAPAKKPAAKDASAPGAATAGEGEAPDGDGNEDGEKTKAAPTGAVTADSLFGG